jgi:hypothetical protein
MRIPLVLQRQLPNRDLPYPIAPQEWRFRQSIEYSISFNRAVIDYAARNREHLLFNIYAMGRRAIDRGSQDTWTPSPTRLQAVDKLGGRGAVPAEREAEVWAELRRPEHRDPRAYVIPSSQPDFLTAIKFVNALREVNVTVHRATRDFVVGRTSYPAGSFVVLTAQAFRPHVLDMFEPQDHPNVVPYAGAPPTPPYDNAGWTLAYQMGVHFDRILEPFSGPFEKVTEWNVRPPAGRVTTSANAAGYVLARDATDAASVINRLLKAGERVFLGRQVFIAAGSQTAARLEEIAREIGTTFTAVSEKPLDGTPLTRPRIGLWDQYGGSMTSGWTRWILEQFGFQFDRIYAPALDAGTLRASYDVLVFPTGGIPSPTGSGRGGRGATGSATADVPAEYRQQLGRVSVERTLPHLRAFAEAGGTIIAIGDSAANLAQWLRLPIDDHLVENGSPLPRVKYFVPGSVLAAKVDVTHPIAAGMRERTDVFFDNSPVFALRSDADPALVRPIAVIDTATPLRSGWAWGQHYLKGGVLAVDARVGKGRVLLFGPEILQRAQPHATFKLLFNGIFASAEQ